MSKILVIHGSTTGLSYSVFKKADLKYGSYLGIKEMIDDRSVELYNWVRRQDSVRFWELHKIIKLYFAEKNDIYTTDMTKQLSDHLEKSDYTTVITHSMGGELLFQTIEKYGLPKTIKTIYTLVSDNPRNSRITNLDIKHRLENRELIWQNYFCFWDQSLLVSSVLNLKFPAGLFGCKHNKHIKNIFYPLHGDIDLHTSIISKPTEIKKIASQHLG